MALLFLEGFEGFASNNDMLQAAAGPCRWRYFEYAENGGAYCIGGTYRTAQVTVANSRSFQAYSRYCRTQLEIPSSTELIVGFGFYCVNGTSAGGGGVLSFAGSDSSGQGIVLDHLIGEQLVLH